MIPNPLKRPLCWKSEHEWIDDPFMGSGQECARCGVYDEPDHELRQWAAIFALGWFIGAITVGLALVVHP